MIEVVSMRRGSGYRKKVGDVYVGRPTAWGNPYEIGRDGTREEVIEKYRDHIARYPDRIRNLRKLLPTRLVCWCAPEACHADVLAEMLAEVAEEEGGA